MVVLVVVHQDMKVISEQEVQAHQDKEMMVELVALMEQVVAVVNQPLVELQVEARKQVVQVVQVKHG
jgi:hypothetical protein